tara:strand:+ start:127 stop:411 length:285 start_codon:yes stop_codon:yes gene_type:complete
MRDAMRSGFEQEAAIEADDIVAATDIAPLLPRHLGQSAAFVLQPAAFAAAALPPPPLDSGARLSYTEALVHWSGAGLHADVGRWLKVPPALAPR